MKKINLSKAEINQISVALFYYKSKFKNLSASLPLTDSLIEKFMDLNS